MKDRWVSESINHVYCRAKIDLMLLQQAPLELECEGSYTPRSMPR